MNERRRRPHRARALEVNAVVPRLIPGFIPYLILRVAGFDSAPGPPGKWKTLVWRTRLVLTEFYVDTT